MEKLLTAWDTCGLKAERHAGFVHAAQDFDEFSRDVRPPF
jgi:hypothetical protein